MLEVGSRSSLPIDKDVIRPDATRMTMDGSEACALIHTALRKCCDSKITSAAYNVIRMIETPRHLDRVNPWRLLGKAVAKRLDEDAKPVVALRAAVDHLLDDYYDELDKMPYSEREGARNKTIDQLHALQCTFQCFSKDDLVGASWFLKEHEDEAEAEAE